MIAVIAFVLADAEHEIEANYSKIVAAVRAHKLAPVESLLAPNFTTTIGGRTYNKAQYMAAERRVVGMVKEIQVSRKVVFAHASSTSETIRWTGDIVMSMVVKGHPHKIERRETNDDIWVKHGSNWLLRHAQVMSQQTILDGKPVSMPGF